MKKNLLIAILLLISMQIIAQKNNPKTGAEVIQAMHDAYEGKWYPNLTFAQKSSFYNGGQLAREQMWYEAMDVNRGLIIKFDSISSSNGLLFMADSQYVYQNNKLVSKARRVHDLLVLGFTVYFDKPETSIAKLKEAGYSLEIMKVENEAGKKTYVIGDATAQFWIDAKTLVFLKLVKKGKDGSISEIQFNNYKKLDKGWIGAEVVFFRNGEVVMKEEYSDIKTPASLPPELFGNGDFDKKTWK